MKTERRKLPQDNDDLAALALTAFEYDDPRNADEGVPGLVESREFTHGGDTVIASGRSTWKDNAVFVTGPVLVSLVGGIGDDANAFAPTSALDRSSSSEDLAIAAAHRGDISKKGTAYIMQFPANNMMSGGDMSHKKDLHTRCSSPPTT